MVISQVGHQPVFRVQHGEPGAQLGDDQECTVRREGARGDHEVLAEAPPELTVQRIHLDAAVRAVGDVKLGFILARVDPDGVRGVERAGVALAPVDAGNVFAGSREAVDVILAIAVRDPDVVVATV